MKLLQAILEEAWAYSQAGRPFLAVFDLDSTLFDLTLRVSTIVDNFAEDPVHRAAYPDECARLKDVEILPTDWGLEGPLARIGLAVDGPFFQALHKYWAECFFSDDYMNHDEPMPGAVEYVQELHLCGAHIMYLTGRDIPRMAKGTEASLREHHFPLVPGSAEMVLKPHGSMDDAQFKLDVLRGVESRYEKIWLFENEPVNLNLIARHCPRIGLIFIDSTHSGREQIECDLHAIRHYEVDLEDFRRLKKAATLK